MMIKELKPPSKVKYDESRQMLALHYKGKDKVAIEKSPVPIITDTTDAIIKVTATTISGSDLHLLHGEIPQTESGDILGHESVGVVDEVGPEVTLFKKGDRVVISPIIACGLCDNCKNNEWSCCDTTNRCELKEEMTGHHSAGIFGYSRLHGGYDGCQAEYVRVPYADINLFPIPYDITDRQALVTADFGASGYHGTELANVKKGDNVVVFGCGPVGLMAQMWSKYRGAKNVLAIDIDSQRLEFAKKNFGSDTINAEEEDLFEAVKKRFPQGADKVIDCVGFRFPDSWLHKVQKKLSLETDAPNIVNAAIKICKKHGTVTLIGDYMGCTNNFNIGALFNKQLTLNGGEVFSHNYVKIIFDAIRSGDINPTVVYTHTFPFSKCVDAYRMFDKHEEGMIKTLLVPDKLYNQQTSV